MENKKTEFKPCWGVMCSFYSGSNTITQKYISTDTFDFNTKPEITGKLINQVNTVIEKECNMTPVYINFQIVWFDE